MRIIAYCGSKFPQGRNHGFDYQGHVEYPIEINTGTSRLAASASAAALHWRHATGFSAC